MQAALSGIRPEFSRYQNPISEKRMLAADLIRIC